MGEAAVEPRSAALVAETLPLAPPGGRDGIEGREPVVQNTGGEKRWQLPVSDRKCRTWRI